MRCTAIIEVDALGGGNTSRGAVSNSIGLPRGRRQLLPRSLAPGTPGTFFGLPVIKGPPPPTEGTLAGCIAFSAGMGSRLRGVDSARATAPMAEARAQAKWADVRL